MLFKNNTRTQHHHIVLPWCYVYDKVQTTAYTLLTRDWKKYWVSYVWAMTLIFFAKCHKLDVVSIYYGFVRVISNRSFAKMAIYAKKWPKNAVFWWQNFLPYPIFRLISQKFTKLWVEILLKWLNNLVLMILIKENC